MLTLVGANLNYSSWTLRPWLVLTHAGLPFRFHDVGLRTRDGWKARILAFNGAGKVPVLIDGALSVHESLAIAEYVAELAPEAGLWPADRAGRARARAMSTEVATSYANLRRELPCNLRARTASKGLSPDATVELARMLELLEVTLEASPGPFLFGGFGIVDAMFAPLLSRLRTYAVPMPEATAAYAARVFASPAFAAAERIAAEQPPIPEYDEALLG
jgi:glutathione S-transferase